MLSALAAPEGELLDACVVEDALAFIDAFYTPAAEPGASSAVEEWRAGTGPWTTTADNLHAALGEVYHKLVTVNRHTGIEKAVLSASADVDEIHDQLDVYQRLCLKLLQPRWTRTIRPFGDPTTTGLLRRRLDEVIACVANGASERPLLQRGRSLSFEDIGATYVDHPHSEFAVRIQSGRFIPFKLSALIKAAWGDILDRSLSSPGRSQAIMFEHVDEVLVQFHDDDDDSQGSITFRRVPLPDGSVLLCWTGVQAAPYAEVYSPQDTVGDSEVHQLGWMRVGRLIQDSKPSSRVYMEGVTDLAVLPACRVFPDYALTRHRFVRFKAMLEARLEANRAANRQRFENRLLDASLETCSSRGVKMNK